jgi:hypothetical protein
VGDADACELECRYKGREKSAADLRNTHIQQRPVDLWKRRIRHETGGLAITSTPVGLTPIMDVPSSGWPEGLGHVLRLRLGHVLDEGGAPTVSSYSSFWRIECRRVLRCSTGRRESHLAGRDLIMFGGLTRTERFHPAGNLQRRQRRFPGAVHECLGTRRGPFAVFDRAKKKCGHCPPFSPRTNLVQPPDCPGFRMFLPIPSKDKARNPVRVPPRARHTPSSVGFLL